MFLKDPQFIDRVETCIRNDGMSLESAIQVTVDELARLLEESDNTYLRERAADVRDLHRRLQRQITPTDQRQLAQLAPESILVARELLPSDLLEFDREHLVGIITETGGETGHAAILARALGVPAVTGIANASQIITPGMPLLIDGQSGKLVLEPAPQEFQASVARQASYDRIIQDAVDAEECECKTCDGTKVRLFANIGRPLEVDLVARHHLDGVGLFRTEYLFLDEPDAPSFELQRKIYCKVAAALEGLPLVLSLIHISEPTRPSP